MKTATKVRDLKDYVGIAALYKLSEPLSSYDEQSSYEYVVVSSSAALGVETYIFGSNEAGEVLDWTELPGSLRMVFNHQVVLNQAGYEVN